MTEKELERARHLFNLIGWWSKQGEGSERILDFAKEGYYLVGGKNTPFPNNKELGKNGHAGLICFVLILLIGFIAAVIAGWLTVGQFSVGQF